MCNRAGVLKEEGSAENNLYKELHIYQILRGHKGEKYTLLPKCTTSVYILYESKWITIEFHKSNVSEINLKLQLLDLYKSIKYKIYLYLRVLLRILCKFYISECY